jgi:hypothetical protein
VLQKDFAQQGGGAGSSLLHGCLFTWKEKNLDLDVIPYFQYLIQ